MTNNDPKKRKPGNMCVQMLRREILNNKNNSDKSISTQ